MGKTKEFTVEEKLRLLYQLQLIDSKIDEIKNTRGELPLEIQDMEDEIEGYRIRKNKLLDKIKQQEEEISKQKMAISKAEDLMKKYNKQQKNVRNNREFEALSKEIEYQELVIKGAEKKIKEAQQEIEKIEKIINGHNSEDEKVKSIDEIIAEKIEHLEHKKNELSSLMKETEKQEQFLVKQAEKIREQIEQRLLRAYDRLRKNFKNGLAVVSIERGSSGGSYFTIPVQKQLEIRMRNKIIVDEHSGRILVDADLVKEEREKMKETLDNI